MNHSVEIGAAQNAYRGVRNVAIAAVGATSLMLGLSGSVQHEPSAASQPTGISDVVPSPRTGDEPATGAALGVLQAVVSIGSPNLLSSISGPADPIPFYQGALRRSLLTELAPAVPMSAEVKAELEMDAVFIEGLNCSGYLIRDENRVAVGARTAYHCGLRFVPKYIDENGKDYFNVSTPLRAISGNTADTHKDEGVVTSVIMPNEGEVNFDTVVLVFGANDPETVFNLIPPPPVLEYGETVYGIGSPANPGTHLQVPNNAVMEMQYIGEFNSDIISSPPGLPNEELSRLRVFVMDKDGGPDPKKLDCIPGASGMGLATTKIDVFGTLSGVAEFEEPFATSTSDLDGAASREYYEEFTRKNLTEKEVACLFDVQKQLFSEMHVFDVHTYASSGVG